MQTVRAGRRVTPRCFGDGQPGRDLPDRELGRAVRGERSRLGRRRLEGGSGRHRSRRGRPLRRRHAAMTATPGTVDACAPATGGVRQTVPGNFRDLCRRFGGPSGERRLRGATASNAARPAERLRGDRHPACGNPEELGDCDHARQLCARRRHPCLSNRPDDGTACARRRRKRVRQPGTHMPRTASARTTASSRRVGAGCGDSSQRAACDGADSCDGSGSCLTNPRRRHGTSCGDAGSECARTRTRAPTGACQDNGFSDCWNAPCGDILRAGRVRRRRTPATGRRKPAVTNHARGRSSVQRRRGVYRCRRVQRLRAVRRRGGPGVLRVRRELPAGRRRPRP